MYHSIVARKIRTAWHHLDDHEYEPVLDMFAEHFTHRFVGQNAMGGTRNVLESQSQWFQRLFRLLPDIRFTVDDVLVRGWPWRTRAVALVRTRLTAAGTPFENEFAQTLDISWGRITRVNVVEDTEKMSAIMRKLVAAGLEEAGAAPISDVVGGTPRDVGR
jgi:ketosteroid isomerase-like protein